VYTSIFRVSGKLKLGAGIIISEDELIRYISPQQKQRQRDEGIKNTEHKYYFSQRARNASA